MLTYARNDEDEYAPQLDGTLQREHGVGGFDIDQMALASGPDSVRLAYVAYRVDKTFIVDNDKEVPLPDGAQVDGGRIVLSSDGKHMAYVLWRGMARYAVVLDGKELETYEGIDRDTLTFSPDGARLAYAASRNRKPLVVVDGKAEEAPGIPRDISFSPSGKRVAYTAYANDYPGGDPVWNCLVVDGKPGKHYAKVGRAVFENGESGVFTPVGERAVEVGGDLATWTVTVEGQVPWTVQPPIEIDQLRVSRDGTRAVFRDTCRYADRSSVLALFGPNGAQTFQWEERDGRCAVTVGGKVQFACDLKDTLPWLQSAPVASPDGAHWAAMLWRFDGQEYIPGGTCIVDGQEVARSSTHVNMPVFSPDSTLCAYVAREGDALIGYVNGDVVATLKTQRTVSDGSRALFSPDSRHVVFVLGDTQGESRIFLDGRDIGGGRGIDTEGLTFSPDSRHVLWFEEADDTWRAVIDGQPRTVSIPNGYRMMSDPFDHVFRFDNAGHAYFLMPVEPWKEGEAVTISLVEETL
jgi:hypothetical protein